MKSAYKVIALIMFMLVCYFSGVPVARAGAGAETPGDILRNFGDVLIYMSPSVAFGMTLGAKDYTGTWQFSESVVVTMGICAGFKYTVNSRRPNGNPQSFPSGHTAICVQSAEFMRKRYGWKYGLPAYAVAAFVGYSRVVSGEHYWRDIFAGALIGFVSTYLITKQYDSWNIQPEASNSYLGVRLNHSW